MKLRSSLLIAGIVFLDCAASIALAGDARGDAGGNVPAEKIRAIYDSLERDNFPSSENPADTSNEALGRTFFSPDFYALWTRDQQCLGEDGAEAAAQMWISGQDSQVRNVGVHVVSRTDDHQSVKASFENFGEGQNWVYEFRRYGNVWLVEDVIADGTRLSAAMRVGCVRYEEPETAAGITGPPATGYLSRPGQVVTEHRSDPADKAVVTAENSTVAASSAQAAAADRTSEEILHACRYPPFWDCQCVLEDIRARMGSNPGKHWSTIVNESGGCAPKCLDAGKIEKHYAHDDCARHANNQFFARLRGGPTDCSCYGRRMAESVAAFVAKGGRLQYSGLFRDERAGMEAMSVESSIRRMAGPGATRVFGYGVIVAHGAALHFKAMTTLCAAVLGLVTWEPRTAQGNIGTFLRCVQAPMDMVSSPGLHKYADDIIAACRRVLRDNLDAYHRALAHAGKGKAHFLKGEWKPALYNFAKAIETGKAQADIYEWQAAALAAKKGGGDASAGSGWIAQSAQAQSASAAATPLSSFKDCETCPEMVVLPPGKFLMGASKADRKFADSYTLATELPQHEVSIGYSFAIAKFELTVAEFAAYAAETGAQTGGDCEIRTPDMGPNAGKYIGTLKPGAQHTPPSLFIITDGDFRRPGANVTDRHPATCISRREAKAYLDWLAKKTGKAYRFPTEAEWEYAARAGNPKPFHYGGGLKELCKYGNFADRKSPYHARVMAKCGENPSPVQTARVGSYAPNTWGLQDMIGNAFEFVEDCSSDNYNGAPTDGSPYRGGGCENFMTRSYFFDSIGSGLRSAARCSVVDWDGRSNGLTIRAAVSLDDSAWDRR